MMMLLEQKVNYQQEEMPKITPTHNKWGKISNRYTRHSVSGIRKGEYFRLGHQFKCGFLGK